MPAATLVCLLGALLAASPAASPANAEEKFDAGRALIDVGRTALPLDERLAAARRVLASEQALDPEATLRAGLALLPKAPEPAAWLLVRATDEGWIPQAARERAVTAIDERVGKVSPENGRRLAAVGMLLGRRPAELGETLTKPWPPDELVRSVLEREIGGLQKDEGARVLDAGARHVRATLDLTRPVARLLDRAASDDPETMRTGLDGLVALGREAVPLLLHEARQGARGRPAGRMPRAARAILALGAIGDRRATPVLAAGLRSTDGWVRVRAAVALGDLGNPAGAVALAEHIATLGDLHRPRDSWDYPGTSGTTIPEADWQTADYYVVDTAAADALLRLGVPRAAGYLIANKLDPSRGNYRIRVFQDSIDALRRALPKAGRLVGDYNVDDGLPQRDAAFTALSEWWHAHRDDPTVLDRRLDETDAGFRKAARALVSRLTGKDVRQFMITKPACELLGPCVTPTLLETLATATRGAARAELAKTLGLVRDPRAVPALLDLLHDKRPFVRAAAADALGAYAERPEVLTALLATLGDPKEGPRVSAVAGLLGAPTSKQVLEAVRKVGSGKTDAVPSMAATVLLFVQEGEKQWPAVEKGLNAEHRYERESWWGLVRRALDLPAYVHDAAAAPDAQHVRRLTRERALQARAERSAQ